MKCSKDGCDGKLKTTHTYAVGKVKFQRAVCQTCGAVHRLDTVAVLPEDGEGAKAMAARVARQLAQE